MSARAVDALRHHRARQAEQKLRAVHWEEPGLVIPSSVGTPAARNNVHQRHFKPLLKRAGLPGDLTPHVLRHTCATLLLSQGVHAKFVQEQLGHATVAMTLDKYSHYLPAMGRAAADGMDAALG